MRCYSRSRMATQVERTLVSLMLLFCSVTRSFGDIILDGPTDLSAQPGQWANFTCNVSCSHSIDWYVEGYQTDITEMCSDTLNGMMVCTNTPQECNTQTSTTGFSKQLSVLAKNELAGSKIAVQCVAVSRTYPPTGECSRYIEYSRFAFLNVGSLPNSETTSTPVVCPSPTVETVTETETVTALPSVSTQTVTTTSTLLVTVTIECTPGSSTNTVSGVRRIHLSSVLRELFTWLCTILTGLAFL